MKPYMLRLLGLSRARKRIVQVTADLFLLAASFFLAMWLRLDSIDFAFSLKSWVALAVVAPLTILVFIRLGFYRAVIRYIASRALAVILLGSAMSGLALGVTALLGNLPIPRSVPISYALLVFLTVGGARFGFREWVANSLNSRKQPVVIYGVGAAGRQLLQVLRQGSDYIPIAFFDDNPQEHGMLVGGLRVYPVDHLETLIEANGVRAVLLALPSVTKLRRSEILKSMEQYPVHLRTIPGLDDIMSGRARIDELNEIGIEDLLGRDPIDPKPNLMSANITGKVVMVTGAGGSIGSELCRQILRLAPRRIVLFDLSELALYSIEQELQAANLASQQNILISPVLGSVQVKRRVESTMRMFKVDTVYHAAAFKHVPLVEQNVIEGILNNVFGTKTVAEAAIATGVQSFIMISTDKAVRPTNIMGASKRLAEMVCQSMAVAKSHGTTLSMVRFGNVLGSSGSVIPLFTRQIESGGPITVTHPDITRFFMTIPEAAQLVIQAGSMAQGGDVFVLDMGEPVRIVDLAARMARLHGLKPILFADGQIVAVQTGEIGIVFTKVRPGEKLFEELLIGNDPKSTAHPRIMTASEIFKGPCELAAILDALQAACDTNNMDLIRQLLIDAPTGYQPNGESVDHVWQAKGKHRAATAGSRMPDPPRLALVSNDRL